MYTVAQDVAVLPVSKINTSFLKPNKNLKKSKKILMIEDDTDMCLIISKSLKENFTCTIDVANDPFEAINLLVDKFYDLIILDWQLPGLNGAETLVAAEKGLRYEPSIPIQWDRNQALVVIFSSAKKEICSPRKTKHFNYAGYISKTQPLRNIIDLFGAHLNEKAKTSSTDVILGQIMSYN